MTHRDNTLRICSYNIHKGFNAGNRRFLLNDIRDAIRSIDADFVFLQEVMGKNLHRPGNNEGNQFEFLADSIWPHYAYGHNAVYDTGHHGNAMLSKHSFLLFENHDVSRWSFSQRGILIGKVNLGVYLVCVHFGLLAIERRSQLDALVNIINAVVPADKPLIIAGDFNDWNRKLHRQIRSRLHVQEACHCHFGRPARTFPVQMPLLPVDRIYFRNLELLEADVLNSKPWTKLSDHCALTATFELVKNP